MPSERLRPTNLLEVVSLRTVADVAYQLTTKPLSQFPKDVRVAFFQGEDRPNGGAWNVLTNSPQAAQYWSDFRERNLQVPDGDMSYDHFDLLIKDFEKTTTSMLLEKKQNLSLDDIDLLLATVRRGKIRPAGVTIGNSMEDEMFRKIMECVIASRLFNGMSVENAVNDPIVQYSAIEIVSQNEDDVRSSRNRYDYLRHKAVTSDLARTKHFTSIDHLVRLAHEPRAEIERAKKDLKAKALWGKIGIKLPRNAVISYEMDASRPQERPHCSKVIAQISEPGGVRIIQYHSYDDDSGGVVSVTRRRVMEFQGEAGENAVYESSITMNGGSVERGDNACIIEVSGPDNRVDSNGKRIDFSIELGSNREIHTIIGIEGSSVDKQLEALAEQTGVMPGIIERFNHNARSFSDMRPMSAMRTLANAPISQKLAYDDNKFGEIFEILNSSADKKRR